MQIADKLQELKYVQFVETDRYDSKQSANFADDLGHPVPDDYLEFLTSYPGTGCFDVSVVGYGLEHAPCASEGWYPLTLFYAACSDKRYDLLNFRQNHLDDFPPHLLVIGDDVGGNFFCLDLRKETLGRVYFRFHDEEIENGLYLLADSFTAFILSLRENMPE
jgi:SMI1/KNR4 family protein SUKH-1